MRFKKLINIKTLFIFILFVGLVLFIVMFNYEGKDNKVVITINDKSIVLEKNSKKRIDLDLLDVAKGLNIRNNSNAVIIVKNKTITPKNGANIKVSSIGNNTTINVFVKFKNSNKLHKYVINSLPVDFPKWKAEGKSKYDGDYYLNVQSMGNSYYLIKINEKGKLVFYKKVDSRALMFKKVKNKKNEIRYTYFYCPVDDISTTNGVCKNPHFVVLDENYKEIDRITNIKRIDWHDLLFIDDNHYILTTSSDKTLEIDGKKVDVINQVVYEIENGKEKWRYDPTTDSDFLKKHETIKARLDGSDKSVNRLEYLHFNSFALDEKDNNLLVSFRDLNCIMKIDRKKGKRIWILGGQYDEFGLTDDQKFALQHAISIENDGTLLLYDNSGGEESRVLEIKIDEKKKKVLNYKKYDLNSGQTRVWGYVQVLDKKEGVYLLNYGIGDNGARRSVEERNLIKDELEFSIIIYNQMIHNVFKG